MGISKVVRSGALAGPAGLWALSVLIGCGHAPESSQSSFDSIDRIRQRSAAQTGTGLPVRCRGVITYSDRLRNDGFVQDDSAGIRFKLSPGQAAPPAGSEVELTGLAVGGDRSAALLEARVHALSPPAALPEPIPIPPQRLPDARLVYKRVRIAGVVQSINSERPGLVTLGIAMPGALVIGNVPASPFSDDWLDAEVQAAGVLDHSAGGLVNTLWIADSDEIQMRTPAPGVTALPVSRIGPLLHASNLPTHRVRIRGSAYGDAQGEMIVQEEGAQIHVRLAPNHTVSQGHMMDLAGFASSDHGHLTLESAVPVSAGESPDPAPVSTLTAVKQVRQLSAGMAQRGYPVRLQAVVTYFDPLNHLLFIQDRADGIFVELRDKTPATLRAGDAVEVSGVTEADFAPNIGKATARVTGHPGLPVAPPGLFYSAVQGGEDSHWIELEGTVQQVARGEGDALVTLAWGRERYKAHVLAPAQALASLVDADVRLRGVCGALFNGRHQLLGIQMFVPGADCVRVLRKPATDPFALPQTLIGNLLHFSGEPMGHCVHLRGTVTYPNRLGATWLRDDTGGVMIQDHTVEGLAAGDIVDVVGFPAISEFSPILRGAKVRRLQAGGRPQAIRTTAQEALKGGVDAQLIEIEGKLVDRLQGATEQVLTIDSGGVAFSAILPRGGISTHIETGAQVRVTGICSVETEQAHDLILPREFRLLLRSPADVAVLSQPPWLTAERLAPMLGGAALLIVASLAWAGLLRRRVRTQTHALRTQTLQLQAAHQQSREALKKARAAEALDQDSKRIVELIARDEPVDLIIDHIAEAVALHAEGAVCAILLAAPRSRVFSVPVLPSIWLQILSRVSVDSISCDPAYQEIRAFSTDPAWETLLNSQSGTRFRTFCAAPIVLDNITAGVIAAFFRDGQQPVEAGGLPLSLWCNVAALALERRRLHDQLSYRAQHDDLTGLPNRAVLYERLESEIASAARSGGLLGLLYVDLDGFKQINDNHGHDAGDVVLRQSARRMTESLRRGDTVARVGGDEFVILLPRLNRREEAAQISEKIRGVLREPIYLSGRPLVVDASIGVSVWPLDGEQPDPLLRSADARMYSEKRRRWYDTPPATPKALSRFHG